MTSLTYSTFSFTTNIQSTALGKTTVQYFAIVFGCQTKIPQFIKTKIFCSFSKTMARLKLAALDTIFLFYQNIFIF